MAKEIRNGIKIPLIQALTFPRQGERNLFDQSLPAINSRRGLSLIAVLWIVAILTVLASEFMYSLQLEVRTSRNWNDQVNAYYAAKGGFETAIANLRVDETNYDSLDEDWTKGFTGILNNSNFETKVIDESSRINVNTADEDTLSRVIQYCMMSLPANQELAEAELTAKAQELASAIAAKRPYRTPAEMAKVDGMTPDILYGYAGDSESENNNNTNYTVENTDTNDTNGEQSIIPLVNVTTVFSIDKNVSNDGSKRVNINSADANAIQQGVNPQGQGQQQVITQQEAQTIVDYRSQSNSSQGGQGGQTNQGGQSGQTTQGNTGGQTGSTQGQTQGGSQNSYKSIIDLLNVPAISQETLDSIRDRIDVQDQQQQGGQNQGGQNQQQKININSASADQLRSLSDRIDDGIANSITNYRQNNRFNSVDDLLQVKAVSIQDLKSIADKVTTTDDATLQGKVNINTVPLEILKILPGMDEQKANAIIAYREAGTQQGTATARSGNQQQQGGPFDNVGQLLDVQGIDENTFRQLVDLITYRTCAFRIESTGKSQDEKIISSFTAIVDRSENSVKIKFWKQG